MGEQTLTALIHGEAGVGKSTLCDTAPAPRLILDAEGRAKYSTEPKVQWDPLATAPPTYDGSWTTCWSHVPDFETMLRVFEWLRSGQHPFVSVCVDSLMEIQKRYIDGLVGLAQLKTQDWGDVLRHLEKLVRDYRDLVLVDTNPVRCVVFTVGSRDMEGKMRPLLQGQLRDTVPYFVDVAGFLYTTYQPETGQVDRALLVQPTDVAVAKDGTRRLPGPSIPNPNLTEIYGLLNGDPPSELDHRLAAFAATGTPTPAVPSVQNVSSSQGEEPTP